MTDGAEAAGRKGFSRRGKAKRGGKSRPPAPASHTASGGEAGVSGRPQLHEAGKPARKRKRRRSRSARPDSGAPASAGMAATRFSPDAPGAASPGAPSSAGSAEGAGRGAVAPSPAGHGGQGEAGRSRSRNRRKARKQRGPQGRPLGSPAEQRPILAERPPVKPGGIKAGTPKPAGPRPAPRAEAGPLARPAVQREPGELYAALDLGTNNCRLLIAQPGRPGQFRVVDAFSRIVRLGEGLGASGRLSDEAMDRAVEALKICAGKLEAREIRRMRLIATEACRAATNGEGFLERVTRETGLSLEIINRETEARLAVSGCSSLVGREARSVVLFDIGGGSSEIAVLSIGQNRSSRLASHITHWTSLPVGVVTLSERHGGRDVTPAIFEAMVQEVEGLLSSFACPPIEGRAEDFYLIGTSGTVTTLAGVHLDLPRYDRRRVDGLWLSDAEVSAMQARLLSWSFAERAANACIGPDRADLVLAGCAILEAIRRRWPSQRMRVADRGLREGLLTDMMADDGVWSRNRARRPGRGRSPAKEG